MGPVLDQGFPPVPEFTEAQVPSLEGKVFLVTGAASGVGFELASILYEKGGKVFAGVRSAEKAKTAIADIEKKYPKSHGQLLPFIVDLSDLTTIRPAAEKLLGQETRLDVLVNNAGVMQPPAGSKTKQGYDLEMGTNCLAPFLLTKLLEPLQRQTTATAPKGSVRTVWVSSMLALGSPIGGIIFNENTGAPETLSNARENYMQSKVGNMFIAKEASQRSEDEIVHVSVHPGIMRTNLQRHQPSTLAWVLGMVFKPARYGAYSEAFAALAPAVTLEEHNGSFIIPWGRFGPIPGHLQPSLRRKGDGDGTGVSGRFWDWIEGEAAKYR